MVETETKIQRYESYKDSGENWLEQVPEHWKVGSLKSVLQERREKNNPVITENILSLSMHQGVTQYSDKGRGGNKAKNDLTAYKIARPNDIVLNSMNVIVGSVGLSKYFGAISPVYYALFARNEEVNIKFYDYIFQNPSFQMSLFPLGNGILIKKSESSNKLNTIRLKIPMDKLNKVLLPIPPLPEQTAIAQFLDVKTTKIDEAIAIKQQQIALLKERKQILIHKAVTRGLNNNVTLKDSGVEWIGEIPEHWEVKRLKNICSINQNSLPETTSNDYEFSYVDIGSVTLEDGIVETETFLFKNAPSRARRIAKCGDTIISTVRTYLKAIDFIEDEKSNFIYSTGFAVLEPEKFMHPKFIASFVRSDAFTEQVTVNSKGMSYPAINSTDLSRLFVVHPEKSEQKEIANYIETASAKIETAISLKEQEISKLQEYKSSLINSVVTGKVKVC